MTIEKYLKPIRKYLNRTDIALEVQVKHLRAVWLVSVRDYLITKALYDGDTERLIKSRKDCTDKENIYFIALNG